MKTRTSLLVGALASAAALSLAPVLAEARPGGGGGNGGGGGSGYRGGGGGGYHGGYHGGGYRGGYGYRYGGYRGWYGGGWGYRGYYPGYYWGGVGLGLATIAYSTAPYYGYYGGYYSHPVAPVAEYIVAEPAAGDRVVRSGQPVPASHPPEPIFYPRNGQTPAQTEADRQDCNRWATTQAGAMSDAGVFQRATYACMDGRGYTVR